jgi:hypothetical protein
VSPQAGLFRPAFENATLVGLLYLVVFIRPNLSVISCMYSPTHAATQKEVNTTGLPMVLNDAAVVAYLAQDCQLQSAKALVASQDQFYTVIPRVWSKDTALRGHCHEHRLPKKTREAERM